MVERDSTAWTLQRSLYDVSCYLKRSCVYPCSQEDSTSDVLAHKIFKSFAFSTIADTIAVKSPLTQRRSDMKRPTHMTPALPPIAVSYLRFSSPEQEKGDSLRR